MTFVDVFVVFFTIHILIIILLKKINLQPENKIIKYKSVRWIPTNHEREVVSKDLIGNILYKDILEKKYNLSAIGEHTIDATIKINIYFIFRYFLKALGVFIGCNLLSILIIGGLFFEDIDNLFNHWLIHLIWSLNLLISIQTTYDDTNEDLIHNRLIKDLEKEWGKNLDFVVAFKEDEFYKKFRKSIKSGDIYFTEVFITYSKS